MLDDEQSGLVATNYVMIAKEHIQWLHRSAWLSSITCFLFIVSEEPWTVWGVVTSISFVILFAYGYWKLIPVEAAFAKKIVHWLNGS